MNYAKATTEQELLDMVAHLESKGYTKGVLCLAYLIDIELRECPYVGLGSISDTIVNFSTTKYLQGDGVSVEEFLKQ